MSLVDQINEALGSMLSSPHIFYCLKYLIKDTVDEVKKITIGSDFLFIKNL